MTHSRRTFLETTLIAGAALAAGKRLANAGVHQPSRIFSREGGDSEFLNPTTAPEPPKPKFPVADYHVHLSNTLTIDQAVQLSKDLGVQIGILEHPRPGFPLNTDADLPRRANSLYGVAGTKDTRNSGTSSTRSCPSGEKGKERSPVAAGLSEHEDVGSLEGTCWAARWNTSFRFALKNRAALQDAFQR